MYYQFGCGITQKATNVCSHKWQSKHVHVNNTSNGQVHALIGTPIVTCPMVNNVTRPSKCAACHYEWSLARFNCCQRVACGIATGNTVQIVGIVIKEIVELLSIQTKCLFCQIDASGNVGWIVGVEFVVKYGLGMPITFTIAKCGNSIKILNWYS